MFTSRAEYRLLLREDNADLRMVGHGHRLGLVSASRAEALEARRRRVDEEIARLAACRVPPSPEVNRVLGERGARAIAESTPLLQLLRRPELTYGDLARLLHDDCPTDPLLARHVEVAVKYAGYVSRMLEDVRRFRQAEERSLPEDLDYFAVPGLSSEIRERLSAVRPRSLGQAGRVPGVTPAAVSILMVWCHRRAARRSPQPAEP
jgi:tRNA uridine 5-carboxymethylaminomethyl modification enzyme